MKGKLVLADGSVFNGTIAREFRASGEVVFNTGMTGYQEILTDPSYCRQIVTLTYPLIGNYGIADVFNQSRKPSVAGFVIGQMCDEYSHWQAQKPLMKFLEENSIPMICDVDTRAVTRKIRSSGTMKGVIASAYTSQNEIDKLLDAPIETDVVLRVTTKETYTINSDSSDAFHVVAMDFGVKQYILDSLKKHGCKITVVPARTPAEKVLEMNPDGIFLSNGPGDPADLPEVVEVIKKLVGSQKPIFGICLGHQLLARACGAETYKLKFGHRGSNQPVKDLRTGRVRISSHNHGFAVDAESLEKISGQPLEITHISMNDGSIEGLRHKSLPIYSVQYHPEAAPGPDDNEYLFDEFISMMEERR